ncbi:MAG: tetratricopeptide repeat protein [Sphingobacteriales bacterium]|nr:MAG: tetratricopeptide repeat protein [Sphingobacteriales bacterium]
MRYLKFALTFFLSTSILFSFSDNIDNNDTLKCRKLNTLIEEEQDHTIWIQYNHQLKDIVLKNIKRKNLDEKSKYEFYKYYSTVYNNYGAYNVYIDNYDSAIINYRIASNIASEKKLYTENALALQNLGTAFDFLGSLDSALFYFKLALKEAKKSKNISSIAYVKTDLGYAYNNLGDNENAIKNNLEALNIFEKLKDDIGIERTCFAIGRIYDLQKDYNSANNYYQKCLSINKKIDDKIRVVLVLNSIAHNKINLKKYTEVSPLLNEAISIAKPNQYISQIATSYKFYADYFYVTENLDSAYYYYNLALDVFQQIKANNFYAMVLLQLAQIDLKKMKLDAALAKAKEAYQISVDSKNPSITKNTYKVLSNIYAQQKDYKNAYLFNNKYSTLADSIFYDENRSNMLKADFKYKNQKNMNTITLLGQQQKIALLKNKQQRFYLIGLALLLLIAMIVSYFIIYRINTKKKNELLKIELDASEKKTKIEQQKNEAVLTALKSQMNPHFIFNALNSIQELYTSGSLKYANEQMGNFAYLTRKILETSEKQKIYLSEEVEILKMYLELESMRFGNDFSSNISFDEDIDEDYIQIPPMLVQPYVENSIKHGLFHKIGNKNINIHFFMEENDEILACTIDDNGIGRNASAEINKNRHKTHQSFATNATEKRLQLLNFGKSENVVVIFEDKYDENNQSLGTKVTIKIPI